MIGVIVKRELTEYRRDRRFLGIFALLLLLAAGASIDGWNRVHADLDARQQAVQADRQIWDEQGQNNPHGAAHFARYAFRALPALAAFDPGVFDHAGAAFWMEAHTQNPTTLRRAEDAAVQAPFPAMSPAWIVQTIGTLAIVILLFPAIAAEREQGTLRALSATGAPARSFATGKAGAVITVVGFITALIFLIALLPAMLSSTLAPPVMRVMLIFAAYAAGLVAFAQLILWFSARASNLAQAFSTSALAWFFLALAWPALAGQLAITVYPDQDEQALKNAIQLQANTPFWKGDAKQAAVDAYEARVIAEYGPERGAETFEQLGFDRQALTLQAHEEFANEVYDRLYGELNTIHAGQDAVLRYASLLSPVLALQRLSSGIAGTDLLAQQRFAKQAEQHRRHIILQLNLDMMINAGDSGYGYTAGRELWEATPDFEPVPPGLRELMSHYLIEMLALLGWLVLASLFALRACQRALVQESP